MKNLQALKEFQIKPTTTKLVIGGAQEYYCWTSGTFTYTSDTDDTGSPSESGDPINCSPVAVASSQALRSERN